MDSLKPGIQQKSFLQYMWLKHLPKDITNNLRIIIFTEFWLHVKWPYNTMFLATSLNIYLKFIFFPSFSTKNCVARSHELCLSKQQIFTSNCSEYFAILCNRPLSPYSFQYKLLPLVEVLTL